MYSITLIEIKPVWGMYKTSGITDGLTSRSAWRDHNYNYITYIVGHKIRYFDEMIKNN